MLLVYLQELANPLVPTREEDTRAINKRGVSIALSHKASEMQEVRPYKTLKRGEPPVCKKPNDVNKSTESQCKRSIIHALTHINAEGVRPVPSEQKKLFQWFSGYPSCKTG